MSNINKLLSALLLAGAAMAPAFAAEVIPMTLAQQRTMGIAVASLGVSSGLASHRLPGEIVVPVGQERVVSTSQPGLIDALYVAPGQSVKKGQALAHISSPELVGLQRDYLQALTQSRLARNTADRDAELYRDGIIAERRYLASKSNQEELAVQLLHRRQTLKLAGMGESAIARLESRQEFSSGLTISSPIAGEILESMVTAGQRVDPAMPLLRIGHLNPLWLEIHAPIETLSSVTKGMSVRIPKYEAEGKIIAVIRNINKNDQTMHIRAEITRHAERLSPGQFVEAELIGREGTGTQFTVPRNAVVRNGADSFVFVQTAKGFIPQKVSVLSEQADKIIVAGALRGSESVAVSGTVAIKAAWVGTGDE